MIVNNLGQVFKGGQVLIEDIAAGAVPMRTEAVETSNGTKNLHMSGIMIQGGIKNQNGRTYPTLEMKRACDSVTEKVNAGRCVYGELDHPDNLNINVKDASHIISELKLQGNDGVGKLRILNGTPNGQIVKGILDDGLTLGVSSRGSGDVNESDGTVSNFDLLTIDIVANPSAPNAYPQGVYEATTKAIGLLEALANVRNGNHRILAAAQDAAHENLVATGGSLNPLANPTGNTRGIQLAEGSLARELVTLINEVKLIQK